MTGCCAFGCSNRAEQGYKLYGVPRGSRNVDRRKRWLCAIKRRNFDPKAARLCEVHFDSNQFEPNIDGKKLKPNAFPSLFLYKFVQKKESRKKRNSDYPGVAAGAQHKPIPPKSGHKLFDHQYCVTPSSTAEWSEPEGKDNSQPVPGVQVLERSQPSDEVHCDRNRVMLRVDEKTAKPNTGPGIPSQTIIGERGESPIERHADDPAQLEPRAPKSDRFDQNSATRSLTSECQEPELQEQDELMVVEHAQASDEVLAVRRANESLRKKVSKLQKEKELFTKNLSTLFNHDQLDYLQRTKGSKGLTWSEETLEKALKLRCACGSVAYNVLLDQGYPFPSDRTLRRRTRYNERFPALFSKSTQSILKNQLEIGSSGNTSFQMGCLSFPHPSSLFSSLFPNTSSLSPPSL
uniref:THAP domain-containing protein 1 n=1 Tax=Eptatretus burgeri TaxID=7764 RepID=A0A8C4QD43_EPTBU